MDCTVLAQNRDKCRAFVNAVMNLLFPLAEDLLVSQEGLCCMQLVS
jgi:hypothetical protein